MEGRIIITTIIITIIIIIESGRQMKAHITIGIVVPYAKRRREVETGKILSGTHSWNSNAVCRSSFRMPVS